jgi:hypothetical protein
MSQRAQAADREPRHRHGQVAAHGAQGQDAERGGEGEVGVRALFEHAEERVPPAEQGQPADCGTTALGRGCGVSRTRGHPAV